MEDFGNSKGPMMHRSFSVPRSRQVNFGKKPNASGARYAEHKDKRSGVKKIIQELQERKEKGIGDLTSMYLERRYNQ